MKGKEKMCVTIVNVDGSVLEEFIDIVEVHTYKWGFDLVRLNGTRKRYSFVGRYSWNANGRCVIYKVNE